jgi:hypothetical protein
MNIEEIEKHYLISSNGNVMKISNKKFMAHNICNAGYHRVHLTINGKRKGYSVHRLVGFKYIANPSSKPEINHIDGNKSNNNVSNLEWVTHQENITHAKQVLKRKMGGQLPDLKRREMTRYLSERYTRKEMAQFMKCAEANVRHLLKCNAIKESEDE